MFADNTEHRGGAVELARRLFQTLLPVVFDFRIDFGDLVSKSLFRLAAASFGLGETRVHFA
ncbi:MAG TPA: hypothetical protein PLV92_12665, partial [Pirellulaceae bacterium]|nr:hypothetical protein [Pirellulaceae bacterium]